MNDEVKFLDWCKQEIVDHTNTYVLGSNDKPITKEDVYMVWCCKTLQNNKALLATRINDGLYYECTYNGDRQEMYMDIYKKQENFAIDLPEEYK